MKKRMFALLMALCLVVSLLPAQVVVAEGTEGENTPVVAAEGGEEIIPTTTAGENVPDATEDPVVPASEPATSVALALSQSVSVTVGIGEVVTYKVADLDTGAYNLALDIQGSVTCSVNNTAGDVNYATGTIKDQTANWELSLGSGTYEIVLDNSVGITDAQITMTLTLVDSTGGEPVPTPVVLTLGSTVPVNGTGLFTYTPEKAGNYAAYIDDYVRAMNVMDADGYSVDGPYFDGRDENDTYIAGAWWALEAGKTYTIECTVENNASANLTLVEAPAPTDVQLHEESLSGYVEERFYLGGSFSFAPAYAAFDRSAITYTSADPAVATVSKDGAVSLLAPGKTTVSVSYGSQKWDIPVEVQAVPVLTVDEETVGTTTQGGWIKYTVSVPKTGEYMLTVNYEGEYNVGLSAPGEEYIVNRDTAYDYKEKVTLEAGKTYQLFVMTMSFDEPVSVMVANVVAPTAIKFACDPVVLYSGTDALPVFPVCEPAYADFDEKKCEITIADTTIAKMVSGYPAGVKPGKTTITAKYGDLTTTAVLEVRQMLELTPDKAVTANTNQNSDIYYRINVPADGDYTFRAVSDKPISAPMFVTPDMNQDLDGAPTTDMEGVLHLKAGVENWILIQGMEPNQEVSVLLSAYSDSEAYANVMIEGEGGEFTYTEALGREAETTEWGSLAVPGGKTITSIGGKLADPTYWTTRAFQGWLMTRILPDANGDYNWDNAEQLGTFTTEQALQYAFEAGYNYWLTAQWEGDDDDYFSIIEINAFDELLTMGLDGETNTTSTCAYYLREDGKTIGSGVEWKITSVAAHPTYGAFQGWMMTKYHNDMDAHELLDEKLYTTAEIYAMKVPHDDTIFLAKWANLEVEDYFDAFHYDIRTAEELTPTAVALNTKYNAVPGIQEYFTFTAPETGMYTWYTTVEDLLSLVEFEDGTHNYHDLYDTRPVCMELEKGDEMLFFTEAWNGSGKFWVEKTNKIVKAEIVSQDTTKEYLGGENFSPSKAMADVTVKVTRADGTTATMTGKEFQNMGSNALTGQPTDLEWEIPEDGKTAKITMILDEIKLSFTVKLMDKTITKLEMTPYTGFKYYENTFGWWSETEDGAYYHYDVIAILQMSSYKITWSDGTVETYKMDPKTQNHPEYHGLLIYDDTNQDAEPWTVGKHTVKVWLGDVFTTFQLEILPNPVESIELQALSVKEYALGDPDHFEVVGTAWNLMEPEITGLKLKVNYNDGTSKVLTEADMDDYGLINGSPLEIGADLIKKAGKYELYFTYMGCQDSAEISVVEKVVAGDTVSVSPSVVEKQLYTKPNATQIVANVTTGQDTPVVAMPATSFKTVEEAGVTLTLKMDTADVTMSKDVIGAIAGKVGTDEDAKVNLKVDTENATLTAAQKTLIQDVVKSTGVEAPVALNATLSVGDQKVTNLGGVMTLRVPFDVPAGAEGEDFDVYYLSEDGDTVQKMPTEFIEGTDGKTYLEFKTDHFSTYVALAGAPEGAVEYTPGTNAGGDGGTGSGSGSSTGSTSGTSKPAGKPAPATGDEANLFSFSAMLMLSGLLAVALLVLKKKSRA